MTADHPPRGRRAAAGAARQWRPGGRHILPVLLALALAGCMSVGGTRPSPSVHDLAPAQVEAVATPLAQQLVIGEPRASQMLDGVRIAVRPRPAELQYYAGAAWRDPAPRLMHDLVLRGFEDAGAFTAVGRSGSGLRGELQLNLELRRFEATYDAPQGPPLADVELRATLLSGGSGRALGSTTLRASTRADAVDVASVVRAMSASSADVVAQLVQWAQQTASASTQAAPSR